MIYANSLLFMSSSEGFNLIYEMLKAVVGNDVGEIEGYVVFLELLEVGFTEVREDEELGVHTLENFRCLVRREVYQLGNDEIEVRFKGDFGEIVVIVVEVTRTSSPRTFRNAPFNRWVAV